MTYEVEVRRCTEPRLRTVLADTVAPDDVRRVGASVVAFVEDQSALVAVIERLRQSGVEIQHVHVC